MLNGGLSEWCLLLNWLCHWYGISDIGKFIFGFLWKGSFVRFLCADCVTTQYSLEKWFYSFPYWKMTQKRKQKRCLILESPCDNNVIYERTQFIFMRKSIKKKTSQQFNGLQLSTRFLSIINDVHDSLQT